MCGKPRIYVCCCTWSRGVFKLDGQAYYCETGYKYQHLPLHHLECPFPDIKQFHSRCSNSLKLSPCCSLALLWQAQNMVSISSRGRHHRPVVFSSSAVIFLVSPDTQECLDADGITEVCQNMCWGAFCVDQKTLYLIYDKASKSVKRSRRKAAGCLDNLKPGNNRCSKGRPGAIAGYNCDEYPFASSKSNTQAAATTKENRCSRCVPSKENSSKYYVKFCRAGANSQ